MIVNCAAKVPEESRAAGYNRIQAGNPRECLMPPTIRTEWFSVKTAASYSDFSVSAIESALRLGKLESRAVKIRGERVARRIKREWIDAWIEGMPGPGGRGFGCTRHHPCRADSPRGGAVAQGGSILPA